MHGLTQTELAAIYGISQGDVSQALCACDVKPIFKVGRMQGLYDEKEAVDALIRRFEKRQEGHMNKALALKNKADQIGKTYKKRNGRNKSNADQ